MKQNYVLYVFIAALFTLLSAIVILGSVPPVSRDALTHHLLIPKLYLAHGGIYEIPHIEFSYYPMNLDLLYVIPLIFGNDIIPKYIHFAFAVLTSLLVYDQIKYRLDQKWALLGVLFFLSIPIIVKLSITVYVDLGLIFFSTASLFYLIKWQDRGFKFKHLIISSIFCGLALGTKYNGLVSFFLLTLFVVFLYSRSHKTNQTSAIGYGLIFLVVSLLIFSPWMIKNYFWTGNPLYPLFNSTLNFKAGSGIITGGTHYVEETSATISHFAVRKLVFGESWWETLFIPVRIFFSGQDNNPKYFDGQLTPFLFLLPFFAFSTIRNQIGPIISEKKILAFYSILYLGIVFFQNDMRIRYISPIIPPLVVLTIYGLKDIYEIIVKFNLSAAKLVTFTIVLSMLLINGRYLYFQYEYVKPYDYLSGRLNRNAYITKHRPEFPAIDYVNTHIPLNSKILALFIGNRAYYFDRQVMPGNEMFQSMVKNTTTPELLMQDLKANGFTHVLINYDLFNAWSMNQFSNEEKTRSLLFFDKLALIFSDGGYGLYQI